METKNSPEHQRLLDHRDLRADWKHWGPYLAERAWGTVREDYSENGQAWDFFPHEHSRSRVYRWNEDGIGGICDRHQHLCFALTLWNERDEILKERFFGLSGIEGNHGESVKEQYYYEDNTPTHSYMRMLYKYPQRAFPYQQLLEENKKRTLLGPEYHLMDTGIFDDNRYFDVTIEYAKADQNDILIQITIVNRGPDEAPYLLLPTLWYRNTWSWGYLSGPMDDTPNKPSIRECVGHRGTTAVHAQHPTSGEYFLYAEDKPRALFTDNETNAKRLWGTKNPSRYVKDAFHQAIIRGDTTAVNPDGIGTKVGMVYHGRLPGGAQAKIRLRLTNAANINPFADFEQTLHLRKSEADSFYKVIQNRNLGAEERRVQRAAFAGLLWTKQLYYFDVEQWLSGDPGLPPPPPARKKGRNNEWESLVNFDVISMPDKWEYPWYASWDLAFHCISFALIDPDFAKRQLTLMTREWYMHPNGQLPAYEWSFSDANPPVHAWAAWRVYKIDAKEQGKPDRAFLEGIFHKLLLNFTWWVNRKDRDGHNIFQGGFLGMDNISLFDRSRPLPTGGHIDQSDGTAWMAFYCVLMMKISLELAKQNPIYQDSATKFFEHCLRIAHAMSCRGEEGHSLWNDEDGFFYDLLHVPCGDMVPLKIRSLVGLLPLLAVETLEPDQVDASPVFKRRLNWFIKKQPGMSLSISEMIHPEKGPRRMVALLNQQRLERVLRTMLDENEFLSPYGLRSVSKYHQQHPYRFSVEGREYSIKYEPAESETGMFGGNSNWRGPIWFPVNYLLIEALQKFHYYYGDRLRVEFPTGSGQYMNLGEVAKKLSQRLISLFLADSKGQRPFLGTSTKLQNDPHFKDHLLFHEYFHGDTGMGLGASHQTGWTGLIAKLLQQSGGNV